MKTSEEKQKIIEWYEKFNKQFEEDSKTKDYTPLSKEWDESFKRAMFGDEEEKKVVKKCHKKWICIAASVLLLVLAGVGITQKEAIADNFDKIFKNKSSVVDSEVDNFGIKEEMTSTTNEKDKVFSYENKTLEEIYVLIKDIVKRPIFQILDIFDECEIEDAIYNEHFGLIAIKLQTEEGKLFISQRKVLDNTSLGAKFDENSILVWNENLQQNIVINKSVQDDSYTFSVKIDYVVFNFSGYISEQACMDIAKNMFYE